MRDGNYGKLRRWWGKSVERLEERRLLSAGALPRGGVITASFNTGGPADANAVAVQQDGKFVVAGTSQAVFGFGSVADAVLIRYNPDATPDPSFGTGGKVHLPRGPQNGDAVNGIAIQGDGKIVVAGDHGNVQGNSETFQPLLVRLNSNGTEDQAFDTNAATGFGSLGVNLGGLKVMLLQPDGKIVVAGPASGPTGDEEIAVVRFNSDGTLDSHFGAGGKVDAIFVAGGKTLGVTAIARQSDGKLVFGGFAVPVGANVIKFGLLRLNADGSLDQGFGTGGRVVTSLTSENDELQGLAVGPDGKIVAVGFLDEGGVVFWNDGMVRYNPAGSLDPTFGSGGKKSFNLGGNDTLESVSVESDGDILTGGSAAASSGFVGMTLIRLRPDGSFDAGFGTGGVSTTQIGKFYSGAKSMAVLDDGRIVAAGSYAAGPGVSTNDQFAVGLFTADGKNDPTFGVPYDVNHDGLVDFGDLLIIGQNYQKPGTFAQGDLNGDGAVGFDDVLLLAQNYGNASAFPAGGAAATDLRHTLSVLR